MDEEYGELRDAVKIEEWEKNCQPISLSELDADLANSLSELEKIVQCDLLRADARIKNYIWAMDEEGKIKIAIEELAVYKSEAQFNGYPRRRGYIHPSKEKKLGHPTLLNGGKARIAGELAFDESEESGKLQWIFNVNSGRYCRFIPPNEQQVENAASLFKEFGLDIIVDYD